MFQRLEAEGADTKRAYAEDWPFDSKFWESDVSVGRNLVSRSSLFFNQWLISRLGEHVSPKSTFTRFKHYAESESGQKVRELLPIISAQARLYESWTIAADDPDRNLSRVELAVYRMKASETEVLAPLLIWLHSPGRGLTQPVIDDVIRTAESWILRRQLLRLPGSDLSRIVAELIQTHADAPADELAGRVRAHLARLNATGTYWPGDDEVRQGLTTEQVYRRFKRGRLRMLLEAVEDAYRSGTNQPQVPRRGYPIEHILPQSWENNWPVPGLEAQQDRAAHVHRLGNLTLLTKSLNSKVSNGPWATKRLAIQEHDTLLLNSRLLVVSATGEWDETAIDARTRRIIDVLLALWPVPEGHLGEVADPQSKAQNWVELKHLIEAGLLVPGTVLTAGLGEWAARQAVVRSDGSLEIEGRVFETPSGAGRFVRNRGTNGWYFWRLPDGRKLVDVRSVFRGEEPGKEARSFDWSALHAILEALPEGSWTTYGSLADAVGTAPQPLGNHITSCRQCANAHRVLTRDGRVAPNFIWSDVDDNRDPLDLLQREGVAVIDGRADPTRELSADELVGLVQA